MRKILLVITLALAQGGEMLRADPALGRLGFSNPKRMLRALPSLAERSTEEIERKVKELGELGLLNPIRVCSRRPEILALDLKTLKSDLTLFKNQKTLGPSSWVYRYALNFEIELKAEILEAAELLWLNSGLSPEQIASFVMTEELAVDRIRELFTVFRFYRLDFSSLRPEARFQLLRTFSPQQLESRFQAVGMQIYADRQMQLYDPQKQGRFLGIRTKCKRYLVNNGSEAHPQSFSSDR